MFGTSVQGSSSNQGRPVIPYSVSQRSNSYTLLSWQTSVDFIPLASRSKSQVKASKKMWRNAMNLASSGLLGVAVGYSGWADREMAGWKLLCCGCGPCTVRDCVDWDRVNRG